MNENRAQSRQLLISVIVPFYNEINLISVAVSSVHENCCDHSDLTYEIIICNDGPFENEEVSQAALMGGKRDIKVLRNRYQQGPGGARNTGLDAARGDLIAFLDADDYWMPGKLSAQLNAVKNGASFVATGYRFKDFSTVIMPPSIIKKSIETFTKRGLGTSTILLKRELVHSTRFRNFRFAQDIDFWYRLSQNDQFNFCAISEALVVYSTSGSTKNKFVQLKALVTVLKANRISVFLRINILARYIAHGIFNHYFRKVFPKIF